MVERERDRLAGETGRNGKAERELIDDGWMRRGIYHFARDLLGLLMLGIGLGMKIL